MQTMQIVGSVQIKNEDIYIEQIILNILDFCDKVIITDHQSTDRAFEICKRLADIYPKIDLISIKTPHEAAICDLPTIHVGYDAFAHGQRFGVTSAFLQRQTHNRRPLRLAASRVAKNEKDVFKYLDDYLRDRSLERDARRAYAEFECSELDGRAGMRLVQMVKSRL